MNIRPAISVLTVFVLGSQMTLAEDYPVLGSFKDLAVSLSSQSKTAESPDAVNAIQTETRKLIQLGTEILELYESKNPGCASQYAVFKQEIPSLESRSLTELHERYHDGVGLPAGPRHCYFGRSQVVHPAMNLVRFKKKLTPELRASVQQEFDEVIRHLEKIKRNLDTPPADFEITSLTEYKIPAGHAVKEGHTLPARRSPGSVFYKDNLYVAGGHFGEEAHDFFKDTFLAEFQAYDFKTKEWRDLPAKPSAGRFSSLIAHNDYLYSFGGFTGESPKNLTSFGTIDRFDLRPESNAWTTLELKLSKPRSQHSVVQFEDRVYIIGGWDSAVLGSGSPTAHEDAFHRNIEVFDLKTETFLDSDLELPSTGRRAFASLVWNNKIILAGGFGEKRGAFLKSVIQLDPATKTWSELPALPKKLIFPMIVSFWGNLYLVGGSGRESIETSYVLTPTSKEWMPTSIQTGDLVERTITQINDKEWLLFGGRFADDSLSPKIDIIKSTR